MRKACCLIILNLIAGVSLNPLNAQFTATDSVSCCLKHWTEKWNLGILFMFCTNCWKTMFNFSRSMEVFPDLNFKPKSHFLKYYPEMIKQFGSLVETFRFERKHRYFRRLYQKTEKTFAKYYQYGINLTCICIMQEKNCWNMKVMFNQKF